MNEFREGQKAEISISIIIPVYNRPESIYTCLSKLAATTFDKQQLEVIVVDDASTDETREIVTKFSTVFPKFKLIKLKENSGGASLPRNVALEQAKGEWLLFIDSDDYIMPYALEDAYALTNEEIELVCMPYFRETGSKRALSRSAFPYTESKGQLTFKETKLYNSLNIVGKLIRATCIQKHNIVFPTNIRIREDNLFTMKVYAVVDTIAILGTEKDYYFIGEKDEVSLSAGKMPPRDAFKVFNEVYQFVWALNDRSFNEKVDILALFMNRYTELIKRGVYAPIRLFNETKETLTYLQKSSYLDESSHLFITELYQGVYDRTEE